MSSLSMVYVLYAKIELNMNAESVLRFIDERRRHLGSLNCSQLMGWLNYTEYVDIEEKKNCLFEKRIEYVTMAECFKNAMERESGFKQVKRYLKKYGGMSDELAQKNADKINRASRVYKQIPTIIQNCVSWA